MATRKFLRPSYTVMQFFSSLNQNRVKYVVLRFFSHAELLESQKDIDILFADEYLEIVDELLVRDNVLSLNQIKIDAYSSTGLPGYGFNKMPYYPAFLAQKILEDRILVNDLYFVPNPEIHLLSYIFHVVYHKSEKSGLPVGNEQNVPDAQGLGVIKEIQAIFPEFHKDISQFTLESLKQYLDKNNWTPSIEWVRKIAGNGSRWLQSLYPTQEASFSISVFILRERGALPEIQKQFHTLIYKEKLSIIYARRLSQTEKNIATMYLRSGNWNCGPHLFSGGLPSYVYILYDTSPETVPENIQEIHGHLSNYRFYRLKSDMRKIASQYHHLNGNMNCIHSCDDNSETFEYMKILFPNILVELESRINHIPVEPQFQVIDTLKDNGRRARIELIKFGNTVAVRKTFNVGMEVFFQRELYAYKTLSPICDFVPKLYECQGNSLIIEYIDFEKTDQHNLLKQKIKEIAEVVCFLWNNGFAHLDIHPGNFVIAKNGTLYLLDYEFFFVYTSKPAQINSSYDLVGMPEFKSWGMVGDNPSEYINQLWTKLLGFSLIEIVTGNILSK